MITWVVSTVSNIYPTSGITSDITSYNSSTFGISNTNGTVLETTQTAVSLNSTHFTNIEGDDIGTLSFTFASYTTNKADGVVTAQATISNCETRIEDAFGISSSNSTYVSDLVGSTTSSNTGSTSKNRTGTYSFLITTTTASQQQNITISTSTTLNTTYQIISSAGTFTFLNTLSSLIDSYTTTRTSSRSTQKYTTTTTNISFTYINSFVFKTAALVTNNEWGVSPILYGGNDHGFMTNLFESFTGTNVFDPQFSITDVNTISFSITTSTTTTNNLFNASVYTAAVTTDLTRESSVNMFTDITSSIVVSYTATVIQTNFITPITSTIAQTSANYFTGKITTQSTNSSIINCITSASTSTLAVPSVIGETFTADPSSFLSYPYKVGLGIESSTTATYLLNENNLPLVHTGAVYSYSTSSIAAALTETGGSGFTAVFTLQISRQFQTIVGGSTSINSVWVDTVAERGHFAGGLAVLLPNNFSVSPGTNYGPVLPAQFRFFVPYSSRADGAMGAILSVTSYAQTFTIQTFGTNTFTAIFLPVSARPTFYFSITQDKISITRMTNYSTTVSNSTTTGTTTTLSTTFDGSISNSFATQGTPMDNYRTTFYAGSVLGIEGGHQRFSEGSYIMSPGGFIMTVYNNNNSEIISTISENNNLIISPLEAPLTVKQRIPDAYVVEGQRIGTHIEIYERNLTSLL